GAVDLEVEAGRLADGGRSHAEVELCGRDGDGCGARAVEVELGVAVRREGARETLRGLHDRVGVGERVAGVRLGRAAGRVADGPCRGRADTGKDALRGVRARS